MCRSLLLSHGHRSCQQTEVQGKLPVGSHGVQYKTLFPIIAEPCIHHGSLIDLNSGEAYPMKVVGNFCLEDSFFPGCPGDSLMFHDNELAEQGLCVPTYKEGAAESTKFHQSPCSKENSQKPPCKDKESSKHNSLASGMSLPWVPNSTSTSKPMWKSKLSLTSKE